MLSQIVRLDDRAEIAARRSLGERSHIAEGVNMSSVEASGKVKVRYFLEPFTRRRTVSLRGGGL
jgi:hypothetical protein